MRLENKFKLIATMSCHMRVTAGPERKLSNVSQKLLEVTIKK